MTLAATTPLLWPLWVSPAAHFLFTCLRAAEYCWRRSQDRQVDSSQICDHQPQTDPSHSLPLSLLRCLPFLVCAFPVLFWLMTRLLMLQRTEETSQKTHHQPNAKHESSPKTLLCCLASHVFTGGGEKPSCFPREFALNFLFRFPPPSHHPEDRPCDRKLGELVYLFPW